MSFQGDSNHMDTERNQDTFLGDDLALVFDLPASIRQDTYLASIYDAIVAKLRIEAHGLPMSTVQTLLLERIAFFYVSMKQAEHSDEGLAPARQKDLISFWQNLTAEFNKQLMAGHEKLRDALLLEISTMVTRIVANVEDDDVRQQLRLEVAEGFAQMGL